MISCTTGWARKPRWGHPNPGPGFWQPVVTTAWGGVGQSAVLFQYNPEPLVLDVTPPDCAQEGGALVQITGKYLAYTTEDIVSVHLFGSPCVNATYVDVSTVSCITGAAATPGKSSEIHLKSKKYGTSTVDEAPTSDGLFYPVTDFTYNPMPLVFGVMPAGGPLVGGNQITVSG